jgi:hypothetical protein
MAVIGMLKSILLLAKSQAGGGVLDGGIMGKGRSTVGFSDYLCDCVETLGVRAEG